MPNIHDTSPEDTTPMASCASGDPHSVAPGRTIASQVPHLLTYAALSKSSGIPIGTLYDLVSKGRIPHLRLGKRLVRFVEADVNAWLAAHKVATGAERGAS